ncbi:odorant receptor 46a-like [Aphis gossypii]|uniref:odorant receptor 46a-like n=1 Tax=Aphis gossypii TaxID=80765 RepID=UPI002159606C|nr:odorant receptor 46a-like [Aphis gossypii]
MATTTKMVYNNEDNLMINTGLMKITGLYHVLDSRSLKIFGHNVFKCLSVVQMSSLILLTVIFLSNIYYFLDDINAVMHYSTLLTSDMISIFKLYVTIVNSDTIWNCIQMTSIDDLSYKYHDRRILINGQSKSKSYSILIMFMWMNLIISWSLAPLFVTNFFLELEVENEIYRYRLSIMNFVFPVTDQFYNENYVIYYCIEFTGLILWCHCTMNFDILLLSMNITFKYQLKTIANSFSTFNIKNYVENNLTKNVEHHKKSELLMFDFKSIIYDQQRVIENMRNIYRIFQPVVLTQLASESIIIILLSCILMMNYFNGISLISVMNSRLCLAVSTFTFHIYVICYLFDDVNQQKDSINFALYSNDWTQSNTQHKHLLLHAMRMNNAENLRLHVTQNRIVNFKMFTSIMRKAYSILSVLGKMCAKKT